MSRRHWCYGVEDLLAQRFPDPATVTAQNSPSGRPYAPDAAEYLAGLVMSTVDDGWFAPDDPAAFRQSVENWAGLCAEQFLWICIDRVMAEEIRARRGS